MERLTGIENLPWDAVRDIAVRVAEPSQGAANVARVFAVSKFFKDCSQDETVLRAVNFEDLLAITKFSYPEALGIYEQFLETNGLVARSAKAGNQNAKFILAKVVMVAASVVFNAQVEIFPPLAGFLDYARSFQFITNFSDRGLIFDSVQLFLSRAEVAEVRNMKHYIQDFVAHFLEPGKETDFQQFLTSFAKFCENEPFIPLNNAVVSSLDWVTLEFNATCTAEDDLMEGLISEEERLLILRSRVQRDSPVGYEAMIERLDNLEPLFRRRWGEKSSRDSEISPGCDRLLFLVWSARRLLKRGIYIENDRTAMVSKYHALFYN